MMYFRLRPKLTHFSLLRMLGTEAPKMGAARQPNLLSATLAFEDPSAFRVKSWGELLRALGIFRLCSIPVLVNHCGKLMSVARKLLGRRVFSLLLRPTVYAQFVAGENDREISQSMEKMSLLGLRPMLAVPIEEDLGESTGEKRYDDNMEAMLECVRMSHSNAWSKDPMMQLKITALISPELCVKLTTLIAQQPHDLDLLVRAMDGEESRSLLLEALRLSKNEGFCLGVKLVRGAYMDKERKLAEKEGRLDPIHQSWEDTNDSYNSSLDMLLEVISQKPERYRIIVATHNEESVKRASKRMEELGIDRNGGSVCFGQLLGMCDHVSLTLAKEGYAVYKSVPYGSVEDTLPYLVRRAQENRTVLQGIRKERDLLRQELRRRLRLSLSLRGGS
ncbi:hydroxyproline dehydrogenase isoform X3 [Mastacembelus armatus]|uniref:hydroxyproline dehydrogenase isoform X3 n=1 Tax=Mastacembelus armatus TaxID=205130 RepID=UPI000E4550EA|nr:hydroxyproline dehydrogenase isoform X3 [Mastacembelus armatus]